jgi:hypothetical protein
MCWTKPLPTRGIMGKPNTRVTSRKVGMGWRCYLASSKPSQPATLKITEEEVDTVRIEPILSILGPCQVIAFSDALCEVFSCAAETYIAEGLRNLLAELRRSASCCKVTFSPARRTVMGKRSVARGGKKVGSSSPLAERWPLGSNRNNGCS